MIDWSEYNPSYHKSFCKFLLSEAKIVLYETEEEFKVEVPPPKKEENTDKEKNANPVSRFSKISKKSPFLEEDFKYIYPIKIKKGIYYRNWLIFCTILAFVGILLIITHKKPKPSLEEKKSNLEEEK